MGIEAKYQAVILARSKGRMDGDGRTDGRAAAVTIPISYYVSAQTKRAAGEKDAAMSAGAIGGRAERERERERETREERDGRLDGLVARPKSIECALPPSKERMESLVG